MRKNILVAIFAFFLVFFGAAGSIFSFAAIRIIDRYKIEEHTVQDLNSSIEKGFESISLTMENAASAAGNISESVSAAKDSLGSAAAVSDQAANAFGEMSRLVDFSILGMKPFEEVAQYFLETRNSLLELSSGLQATAEALDVNAQDIKMLGSDLVAVSSSIDAISKNVAGTTELFSMGEFYRLFDYLLIYLGVMHLMFILIGLSFFMVRKN